MDKSYSDSHLNDLVLETTPPNFVNRNKRRREEDTCKDLSFKDEIKEMITTLFTAQQLELQKITANLSEIKETNSRIELSVEFLSKQNEELHNKIKLLEIESQKDKAQIIILEEKIEDLQRTNRKTCLEIKNVPKKTNETKDDLINMVVTLSNSINRKIDKSDIKDIFRVKGKKVQEKNCPIVVETSSTIIKTDFLKSCKLFNIKNKDKLRAKHLGFTTDENSPIFVSEQLTGKGARLFFLARDLVKTRKYKFCWTSFGKVYVRKDENSPIINIISESQIHHLQQET